MVTPPRPQRVTRPRFVLNTKTSRSGAYSKKTQIVTPMPSVSPKKKAPTMRDSSNEMVTVHISDPAHHNKSFTIHKDFLCHYSSFFNAAFNGSFNESLSKTMDFEAPSCDSFGLFVDWVYSQKLEDGEGELPCAKELVNLWVLADSILVPGLQNKAMEAINERAAKHADLPSGFFVHLYQTTTEESKLRALFVDMFVAFPNSITNPHELPYEMLVDIIEGTAERHTRQPTRFSKDKMSKYFVDEEIPERR